MTVLTPETFRWPSKVVIDEHNSYHGVQWCAPREEWMWHLIWEDGSPYGTHVHTGFESSKAGARAALVRRVEWVEDRWPDPSYYDFP
jgi:hypothetical protein